MSGSHATAGEMSQHLAILKSNYLSLVLAGAKTVECRLTRVKAPPFGCVRPGELVWLKESCGPVRGVAHVTDVAFFEDVDAECLRAIQSACGAAVAAPASFWTHHGARLQCSLITLDGVLRVEPFRVPKRDPRAWVVLPCHDDQTLPASDKALLARLRSAQRVPVTRAGDA